jgi:hypothetical protein
MTTKKFKITVFLLSSLLIGFSNVTNAQFQANDDNASTFTNLPVVIHVRVNDTYPFGYQVKKYYVPGTITGQPVNGTIEVIGDDIIYTPNQGFQGPDAFIYAYSLDGTTFVDSAMVNITVNQDSDPAFHLNFLELPPATCLGGKLKVFIENGTAPYVYQINGSALTTTLADSIIVENFSPHTGTITVTDANNFTVNASFTIPGNARILCLDGPMSGYTSPNQCLGSAGVGVFCGTPPFVAVATNIQNPAQQFFFEWEGGDSHSRRAFATNLCQGMYNLMITDSNNVQNQGGFLIDTNSTNPPIIIGQFDTCIAINNYLGAYVSDVYANSTGVYAVWNITLATNEVVVLNVHYNINTAGTYQFILYLNCDGGKSTTTLTSYYTVTSSDLVLSVLDKSIISTVKIYPNPITDFVSIDFESIQEDVFSVNIVNILGESVYQKSMIIKQGMNKSTVDFSSYSNGVYFVQIFDKKLNSINVKVIK